MTQLPSLRYLNLDIFCFDHREGLGQDDEKLKANRQHFLGRITNPALNAEQIEKFQEREQEQTRFNYLLPAPHIQAFPEPMDGYYAPVKIGDSYGLQINCSGYRNWQHRTCEAQDLEKIYQFIQDYHQQPGQLGETWLVWGKLTQDCCDLDFTKLAQELLRSVGRNVSSNWNEQQQNQCQWQEATLCELSEIPNQPFKTHQTKPQVLICLFPHHLSDEAVLNSVTTELYPEIMQVAYYRSKILWIYNETRDIKQGLKNQAPAIQKIVAITQPNPQGLQNKLDTLQNKLEKSFNIYENYATWLSYLEEYRYALQVNSDNYQKRFCRFLKINTPQEGSFFLTFQDYVTEQFIPQVTNDYNTLSASSALLDNSLKTTEGLIRLEQTRVESKQQERDRNIENLIGAASVGVGFSSAAAGAWAGKTEPIHTLGISVGLGLLFGAGVYWGLRGLQMLWRNR